jgi:hypothetical protein
MGIEFEMCVPNVAVDDDSGEGEYDYDMDERAYDIDGIIEFFRSGEMSNLGSSSAQRLRSEMWDQFLDWQSGRILENIDTDELNDRVRDRLSEDIDWEDYLDDAREELGDEASDDRVEERAKELAEEVLDNEMSDASSRNYERAYDDIREEMEDEMRNDGDYDQQAWLSDIGIDYMSEAEREWSLDWPHWTYYGGGGELDVETVADEFGRSMGLEYVNSSNSYHGARRDGKNWIVEPDSSIDADEGDGGLEFVSPPMPIKDGLEMLQKMYKWAKDNGCYTNKSTGLHMNISVPDMTIEKLDYVKLALFMGDEYILKQFGRQYNSYAKSAMSKIRDRIRPEEVPTVLNTMKQHLNSLASKTIHSGITDKYTSINTKDNYVEFRGPGGDYLDMNPFEVTNTVLRLAMSLRIATNPEAYKQEYAKKLYKLVEQDGGDWTDPNNSVALFSRYALGEIGKAELVDNVRQAQIARKEKKGEEQQYWVMNKDGSGGKQMVFATSSTEAIIKGGSQMGMKREESISKLKAEPFVDNTQGNIIIPNSLSSWWQNTLRNISNETLENVQELRSMAADREQGINPPDVRLDTEQQSVVLNIIDNELRGRMGQGVDNNDMTQWRVYITRGEHAGTSTIIDAVTPRQAKVAAQSILRSQVGSFVNYEDLEARESVPIQTTPTTSREMFDGLPSGWQEFLSNISDHSGAVLQNMIDMVANGQAHSARDLSIEQRDAIIGTINVELRRRNGIGDALNSLSQAWQSWLGQVNVHANETLENMLRTIEAGTGDVERMTPEQRNLITTTIEQELRSRQTTNYNTLAANAARAENVVFQSLPDAHREWLSEVSDKSDMDLINVLRNLSAEHNDSILSDQQKAYFRITIKHELRRRGINADSELAQDPAAQQQALVRDDPVTSNDAEATDGPGMWMVGNHTYGRETFQANSREEAIQAYAERNGIDDIEAFKAERSFVAQLANRPQTNESINTIRKLAGLA